MDNEEILIKLTNRTIKYFQEDLCLPVENDYELLEVDKVDYLDRTSLISLSKDLTGTVGMSVSKELAHKMVENFIFGEISQKELCELSSENVAETLNITVGNILKELDVVKAGGSVNISTPYTIQSAVTVTKKKGGKMYFCQLKFGDESILVSYFL